MSNEPILIYHEGVWLGECEEYAMSMPDAAFKEAIEAWLTVRNVPAPTLSQKWVAVEYCRKLSYWQGFWKYREPRVKMIFKLQEKR